MNLSSSKHSNSAAGSGESGWTMYLEQSFISSSYDQYPIRNGNQDPRYEWVYGVTEELDLSMVSDASSGPLPHLQEENHEEDCCRCNPNGKPVRKPKKENRRVKDKGFYQSLDDTASSNPSHNLSIQKEEVIYGSKVSTENSMESNGRQFKGKSTSVRKSYSRSSVK